MKITQVADYFDARTGNPLAIFVKELSKRDHEVLVLTSSVSEKPGLLDDSAVKAKIERFSAIRIESKAIFPWLIPRLLFARDLGIVHAHVLGFFSLFVCALLKPIKRYKLVVTPDFDVSNPVARFPKSVLVWLLMRFPLQQADLVLPFTEIEKTELKKRFGVPLQKMRVLPIGISTEMFQEKPKRDYRKELKLENNFVLLSACFLHPKKNLEMVLEALEQLPQEIVLVHAGGFPNKAYKEKIVFLVAEKGLQERVFFLGNKTVEEMADAFKSADAFVQAGFKESYCIPVLEAMAASLPVITTRVGIATEVIRQGENGFFVKNAQELEKAVMELFEKETLRSAMAIANKEKAKRFGWQKIVSELENHYKTLSS